MIERKAQLSREALVQSIMYHTRVERNPNYVRILRGLQVLAIERSSFHVDSVLGDIASNNRPSMSEALDLAGMLPGTLGRTAQGLRILDFGGRTIQGFVSGDTNERGMARLEHEVRQMVESIYQRVANDPDQLVRINRYLPAHLGQFGMSYEDIVNVSPQFSDHIKLKLLAVAAGETRDLMSSVQEDIARQEEMLRGLFQAQLNEQEYQNNLRSIEEYATYGKLVAKLVSFENRELGRRLLVTSEAYRSFSNVSAAVAAGQMSTGLATANYALIAIGLVEAFSSDGSEGLSGALAQLQEMIAQATEVILERLADIENRLGDIQRTLAVIYREILEQGRNIRDLHLKVDELQVLFTRKLDLLLNATRAGFARELDAAVVRAVGHKDMWRAGYYTMPPDEFRNLLFGLYSHASVHSADALSTAMDHRSLAPEDLLQELNVGDFASSLPYLSLAMSQLASRPFPRMSVDPGMWVLSTSVLLDLLGDWPDYQEGLDTVFLKEVSRHGEALRAFVDACTLAHARDDYRLLLHRVEQLFREMMQKYAELLPAQVLKVLQGSGHTNPQTINSVDWAGFQRENFHEIFADVDGGLNPFSVSVHYVTGSWGRTSTSVPAEVITQHLPSQAKCAAWLGGRFTGHYKNSVLSSSFPFSYVDVEFYVDLHLKEPGSEQEKTYRVLWARRETNEATGGYRDPVSPSVYARDHIKGLLSNPQHQQGYSQQIRDNLEALEAHLHTLLEPACLQIGQLLVQEADMLANVRKYRTAYRGIMELIWRCLVLGSNEAERRILEDFFVGAKAPRDQLTQILSRYSLVGANERFCKDLEYIKEKLDTAIEINSGTQQESWSIMDIDSIMTRLRQCIASIESGEKWKTLYGMQRLARVD